MLFDVFHTKTPSRGTKYYISHCGEKVKGGVKGLYAGLKIIHKRLFDTFLGDDKISVASTQESLYRYY